MCRHHPLRRCAGATLALLLGACGGGAGVTAAPPATLPEAGAPAIDEAAPLPPGYRLVWADEFEQDGLPDPGRWAYDTARNAQGWYNNEAQYYAEARAENARVAQGELIIEAHRETLDPARFADWGGQAYTSARLITRGRAQWTYGFIEVRAMLPCGTGTWPAIWTLSAPPASRWPDDGEIDILEHVGFEPGVVHGSVHTRAYHHSVGTHRTARRALADACSAFHRYQLHWTPERITVGVDDRAYFQFRNDGSGDTATWPFKAPQYLLLNLAVGGSWGGAKGIDPAAFPARMRVDYVRVYQQEGS